MQIQASSRDGPTGRAFIKDLAHPSYGICPAPDGIIIQHDQLVALRERHSQVSSPSSPKVLSWLLQVKDDVSMSRHGNLSVAAIVNHNDFVWAREVLLLEN